MTLRELGDQFSLFLSTQLTEIESLGSKNIVDWPIGYSMLAGVLGLLFLGLAGSFFDVLGDWLRSLSWTSSTGDKSLSALGLISAIVFVVFFFALALEGLLGMLRIIGPLRDGIVLVLSVIVGGTLWWLVSIGRKS